MKCPKCQSEHSVKSGHANGNPRRLCKQCGCNYTRSQPRGKSMELKRQAVQMYLEGMGFRAIGRVLGVSNVSVLNWVRAFGERLEPLRAARAPEHTPVIECDELWHFVGVKKENCGCGLLLTDSGASRLTLELGSRQTRTGRRLWERIKGVRCAQYATDAWHAYTGFIPEALHTRSKRETHSIESFNATVRHYLARFHRKAHCYSKSVGRVRASLNLLFL